MGTRENSVKRYVVRLSAGEREQLETLIRKGKSPAQRLLKARILLKADISEVGAGWSDSKIIAALETSASMVYRVRKKVVELNIVDRASDSTIGRVLKKHSQAPSPRTMGHSAQGQQRIRRRDGGRIGRLQATARP